jgi:phosphoribosylglycinamide formyltransferase-1
MIKLGIMASGRGSNLQSIIDNIKNGKLSAEIAVVISDNPEAYALERAKKEDIKTVICEPKSFPKRMDYENALVNYMKENKVDLVVLAGYMRIVKPPLIEAFPHRIINIHPALLPSFPGLHGQKQAVDYGVKISGCTVHFIDNGVDTGPIILQESVPVKDDDTEDTLSERILKVEHQLLPKAIQLIAENKVKVEGRKVYIKKSKK